MKFETPCLLFDEECPLCKRFAQSLQRTELQTKIHYYSIYEEGLYDAFPFLNKEEVETEVHLVLGKDAGTVLKGAQVVSFFATQNPAVQKFAWLIESDTGQKAMDVFYKGLNKCRETLRSHCPKCKNKRSQFL